MVVGNWSIEIIDASVNETLSAILEHKIIVIVRGARPDDFFKIAGALLEGGLRVIEVTLNSTDALSLIKEAVRQWGDQMVIGAGTVLDAEEAKAALSAGARFIISPSLNRETIRATKRLGGVSIPGAFTPTEILEAHREGGDIIKVFPASVGANYFRDIRGPLPHIPLMPTGGVNLSNIGDFQRAGAVAFGIGGGLINTTRTMTTAYLQEISEKAVAYREALKTTSV
jgi:2-dehydro-3-deoxyphosphogluconate aldolase / (4S)-4-hydroxy-2-oxoglutarate aldolase